MNDRTKTTLGVVLGLIAWPASGQVVVEGLPLAKRLVTIDHASLSTAAGRRAARVISTRRRKRSVPSNTRAKPFISTWGPAPREVMELR
jgi:hypothetical protein